MTNALKPGVSVGEWLDTIQKSGEVDSLINFRPSRSMTLVKKRFWADYKENPVLPRPVTQLTLQQIIKLCGYNITRWVDKEPLFMFWLLDEKFEEHTIQSNAEEAIDLLMNIIRSEPIPKLLTIKEQVSAANIILQLANRFPSKQKELVYVDKELGRLSESETDRQLQEAKKQLSASKQTLELDDEEDVH